VTVQPGSRYINTPIVDLTINGQTRQVLVPSPQTNYSFTYTAYMVTGEDRIDTIANDFYGDPTLWFHIAQGNPEILNWSNLPPGSIIRIPGILW
jgi:hypothetical protein